MKRLFCTACLVWGLSILLAFAEEPIRIPHDLEPLDLTPLEMETVLDLDEIVTDRTIFANGLTPPSLWWIIEQSSTNERLIQNWIAYPQQKRVDVLVNAQVWSLLTYFDLYRFVHQIGTDATGQGYNLRIFNRQSVLLAAYTCDFETDTCSVWFNPSYEQR